MKEKFETTGDLLNANAQAYPEIPFLIYYDEIVTYKDQIDARVGWKMNVFITMAEIYGSIRTA